MVQGTEKRGLIYTRRHAPSSASSHSKSQQDGAVEPVVLLLRDFSRGSRVKCLETPPFTCDSVNCFHKYSLHPDKALVACSDHVSKQAVSFQSVRGIVWAPLSHIGRSISFRDSTEMSESVASDLVSAKCLPLCIVLQPFN